MPSKIPTHRPAGAPTTEQVRRSYEQQSSRREDIRFYQSKPWTKLRRLKLVDQPLCEPCLALGITTEATQVHHVIDRKDDASLALDYDNLESVCLPCHNAKRARSPRTEPYGCQGDRGDR